MLFWMQDAHTNFGSVFTRLVRREPEPEEPRRVAGEFEDAHNPQWTPDGRVLLCGTLRTNVKEMEHDLWIVPVGGVEEPVKTGILPYLRNAGIDPHPRALKSLPFRFYQGSLLFAGVRNDRTNLYQLRLSAGFQPKGEPILLHEETDSQDSPSLRGGVLAYTSLHSNLNVWSIPLGSDGGSAGEARRLTDGRADEVFPSVSADGHQLVYLSLGSPASQLWKKDLVTGIESEVFRHTGMNRAKALSNGAKAFVRILDGPAPQLQEIDTIDLSGGPVQKLCGNCGSPTSVSSSGDYIVHETGSAVSRLAAFHVPTGRKSELLRHPHHSVQAGRISPDGGWIVFELDRGPDGVRLFVAPFHGLDPIPEGEWIPVSDPTVSSFEPAWSPDGSKLYFLSDRSGSRDLWLQRLQPNRRPLGNPDLVYRFADARLTPLTYHVRHPRYVGLSIAANQAVLTLSELGSSIWLGRLTR